MKRILIVLLLLPLLSWAQTKTTQGAQIVVGVKQHKNEITAIYALSAIKKDKKHLQCGNCSYYLGELKGAYEQQGAILTPEEGATITVFTEQEVFTEKKQFSEKGFETKKEVVLGKARATVVENKKGTLILKTKHDEN